MGIRKEEQSGVAEGDFARWPVWHHHLHHLTQPPFGRNVLSVPKALWSGGEIR